MRFLLAGLSLLAGAHASGVEVTLAWDRPADMTGIAGFHIYYGTSSGNYTTVVDAGNSTTKTVSLPTAGTTYYFVATSYDASGLESEFSNEVVFVASSPTEPVNIAPSISTFASQVLAMSTSSGPIGFTVSDADTATDELRVTTASSNATLLPSTGLVLGGSGSARTLTITPAAGQTGTATVTVRVSDGALSASRSFTVTVLPKPSVVLASPSSGSSFVAPASMSLVANVASNGNQILKVGFYKGSTLIREDTSPPYSYTWSQVPAGTYSLTARVYPKVGSSVSSAASSVAVANPPPTIALTAPSSGSSFAAPAAVGLSASVTANGNTISKVRFYKGSTLLGEDATAPYTYTWSNVGEGTYTLSATVIYNTTKSVSSASRTISVTSADTGPIIVDAADALISPPFFRSNGLITQGVTTDLTDGGRAEYSFYVPEATNYVVYLDVDAPGTQANSLYVNVDDEPEDPVMIWAIPATVGLQPAMVAWRGTYTTIASIAQYSPKVFNLTPGTHKLVIRGRAADTLFGRAKLTPVSGLSGSWRSAKVGSPATDGIASVSGGDYTVMGAGTIGSTTDSFHFLYQPLTGDGELRARLMSTSSSGGNVGVMIRENLTSGSKFAMMSFSPSRTFRWSYRQAASGATTTKDSTTSTPPNTWLRLVRSGSTITGYQSTNGSTWVYVGSISTVSFASNIYFGLVSSSGGSSLNTAVFRSVAAVP